MASRRGILSLLAPALGAAGTVVLLGCGSASRSEAIAPRPLPASQTVRSGERLFNEHCSQCHPHGEGGVGPSLLKAPLPGFAIRLQVRNGFGAMPAFSREKLSPGELDDVVAYLKALRSRR
jgi:mono/diheme cytochrome c family protein